MVVGSLVLVAGALVVVGGTELVDALVVLGAVGTVVVVGRAELVGLEGVVTGVEVVAVLGLTDMVAGLADEIVIDGVGVAPLLGRVVVGSPVLADAVGNSVNRTST